MNEYDVWVERINPCGGVTHAVKELIEVETDDPKKYAEEHSPFPIMTEGKTPAGDLVITTGDSKGYMVRYTFMG